jgi:hypothetical protein
VQFWAVRLSFKAGFAWYRRTVIVLVAIPAVLVLGWLLLRGRHQDAS